jgi:hypothetical protein
MIILSNEPAISVGANLVSGAAPFGLGRNQVATRGCDERCRLRPFD